MVVEVAVRREGRPLPVRLLWGPGIGNASAEERDVRGYAEPQGVALVDSGSVELLPPAGLAAIGQALAGVRWVGVESLYFAALMIPAEGSAAAQIRPIALTVHGEEKPVTAAVAAVDATGAPCSCSWERRTTSGWRHSATSSSGRCRWETGSDRSCWC